MERKAFSFMRSFFEAAKLLENKEDQADFLMAVCNYGLNGIEPEESGVTSAMFQLVKPNIDSALAKAVAGSKGGKANRKQIEANESNLEPIKDKGLRIKDKGDKEKVKKEKPPKHKYGKYNNVLLSDIEMEKLQAEFPLDWEQRIENVSEYCASHGKNYTDYLATIRNWARREANKQPMGKNDAQAGFQKLIGILGEEQTDEQS